MNRSTVRLLMMLLMRWMLMMLSELLRWNHSLMEIVNVQTISVSRLISAVLSEVM